MLVYEPLKLQLLVSRILTSLSLDCSHEIQDTPDLLTMPRLPPAFVRHESYSSRKLA